MPADLQTYSNPWLKVQCLRVGSTINRGPPGTNFVGESNPTLTKLTSTSLLLTNKLTIRPCESFFQEIISSEHLDEIKVTTPPCLPEAGDLKLRPGHLRDRDLMVDSELIKVS